MHLLKTLVLFVGIIGASVTFAEPAAARGKVAEIAGRVLDPDPQGGPIIVRLDGRRDPARYPAVLYGGDTLLISPGSALTIRTGAGRKTLEASANAPLVYKVPEAGRPSPGAQGILEAIADFFERPPSVISTPTYARGPDGTVPGPEADRLMPNGRQWTTSLTSTVTFVWRGMARDLVVVSPGGQKQTVETHGNNWVSAPLSLAREVTVLIPDSEVSWRVGYRASPPLPPGFANSNSDRDRLAVAVWLLQSGHSEWGMFAISEIASLASSGDVLAVELWSAVEQGRLAEALGLQPQP